MAEPRRVVIAANGTWNIVNFRAGLIRALKAHGYQPVIVAPADPEARDRMAELEVEHIAVEVQRSGLNPLADLRLLLQYRGIFKAFDPVAYLGFTIKPNIYGCLAARWTGVPAIPNVSGLGTVFIRKGPLVTLVSSLYRAAFRRAAVVFFQNPDDAAAFVERGLVRPEHAKILPGSGVDLRHFPPTPLPGGPTTFLLIGRLLGDKGVREFVEAARRLRSGRDDVKFQLLGPLDEGNRTAIGRAELERWVAEGTVEYLGTTDDVRPFISAASVVVLPSYREGLPRSLLEAAAMGRPLVATGVPGCREVVYPGVNGSLCIERDAYSLAEAMRELSDLPIGRLKDMGAASRKLVEERFSEERVIASYLEALGNLARRRSLDS